MDFNFLVGFGVYGVCVRVIEPSGSKRVEYWLIVYREFRLVYPMGNAFGVVFGVADIQSPKP